MATAWAFGAAAFSGGAPASAAVEGCTCHSTTESGNVGVTIEVPQSVEPGHTYNVTVALTGPSPLPTPAGQNQGGFAAVVSGGALAPVNDETQIVEGTATHTQAGNDQRGWTFSWTTPIRNMTREGEEVTFTVSANAVNGDGLANQLDEWSQATATSTVVFAGPGPSQNPSPSDGAAVQPGFTGVFAVAALAAALLVWRRRV